MPARPRFCRKIVTSGSKFASEDAQTPITKQKDRDRVKFAAKVATNSAGVETPSKSPRVRESKRRLVCIEKLINRTPSEAAVHTKAETPAFINVHRPSKSGKRTHAVSQRSRTPTGAAYLTSTPYSPLDTEVTPSTTTGGGQKPGKCIPASPRVRESRYPPSPHPRGPKRSRTPTGSPHRRSRNRTKVTTVHALLPLDTKAWQMSASIAEDPGIETTFGSSIERRQRPDAHAKAETPAFIT